MNPLKKDNNANDFMKPRKIKNKLTNRKQSVQPLQNQGPIILPQSLAQQTGNNRSTLLQPSQNQMNTINYPGLQFSPINPGKSAIAGGQTNKDQNLYVTYLKELKQLQNNKSSNEISQSFLIPNQNNYNQFKNSFINQNTNANSTPIAQRNLIIQHSMKQQLQNNTSNVSSQSQEVNQQAMLKFHLQQLSHENLKIRQQNKQNIQSNQSQSQSQQNHPLFSNPAYANLINTVNQSQFQKQQQQTNLFSKRNADQLQQQQLSSINASSFSPQKDLNIKSIKKKDKIAMQQFNLLKQFQKEQRIQQIKDEIKKNDSQLQQQYQLNGLVKLSQVTSQQQESDSEEIKNIQSNKSVQQSPYLNQSSLLNHFANTKKEKINNIIKTVQTKLQEKNLLQRQFSCQNDKQKLISIDSNQDEDLFMSPQFKKTLIVFDQDEQSGDDPISPLETIPINDQEQNDVDTLENDNMQIKKNIQGLQGECQTDTNKLNQRQNVKNLADQNQINTKTKQGRINQFSFGQISPKFYQDQPAANLLESKEQSRSRQNKKDFKKSKTKREHSDYLDVNYIIATNTEGDEDNEASLLMNNKQAQKFLQSQQFKADKKTVKGPVKLDQQVTEYLNARDLYSDLLVDDLYNQSDSNTQTLGSQGQMSKDFGSQDQNGTLNYKRMRVESFAKTPCFLKSPRSLASSQVGHHIDIENEYVSLNTYNGDIEHDLLPLKQIKRLHLNKLSQSSDEISKTVNIFFEQKGSILDQSPSQDYLINNNYTPLLQYQISKITNANRKSGDGTNTTNIYIEQKNFNQIQILNNQYMPIPLIKHVKTDAKKGKFRIPKMSKISPNINGQHNENTYQAQIENFLLKQQYLQKNNDNSKVFQQQLLRASMENGKQINGNVGNNLSHVFEDKITHTRARPNDNQIMRKSKFILLQHQQ
ncbi:UNKNOWN [Stylonychia lemnae]|uniref:Uncharacterized protein n=1 Tax=Stylonychia lemnae TaxID=5949 RepID=A0A078ARA8_STYLE|nr:UNKNOWN [Stylonychia lemnae]|eukprot:CDW84759.1 UNKNOWN [Stylonychia lemnae]